MQTPTQRHDPERDGARRARHPHGRRAPAAEHPQVDGRFDRPLGRRHAGRRHDQLHRARRSSAARATAARRRALHAQWTRTRCSIASRSRIRRRGIARGPASIRGVGDRTSGSTNTPATRATTRSAACCAARVSQKWRAPSRRSSSVRLAARRCRADRFGRVRVGNASAEPATTQTTPSPGPQLMSGLGDHHHPDCDGERRSAEVLRPGDRAGVRLQPRGSRARRSSARPSSIPRPRCRTGASRGRSAPTTTSTSTIRARRQAYDAIAAAKALAASGPAHERDVHRGDGGPLLGGSEGRSRGAGARVQQGDGRAVEAAPRRPRRRDALRREPDEPDGRGSCGRSTASRPTGTEQIVGVLESVLQREPESSRREPLLHPHRGGVAQPGARAGERGAPRHARARSRAPASTCRRTSTRARATTRPPPRANLAGAEADRVLPQDGASRRLLRAGVLPAQPALPRRLAHDAGAIRGRASGRRRSSPNGWRRTPR